MLPSAIAALIFVFEPQAGGQIHKREVHESNQNYRIDIKYPEMDGATPFDPAVHKILDPLLQSHRDDKCPPGLNHESYLKGDYTATTASRIVSVLLKWEEYTCGAAHPGGGMASINYDVHDRRVLKLSDFFRPGVNYLFRLSALSVASLNRQEYPDADQIKRGAGPLESNFRIFTVTDDALTFYFPTYQVAAGAAGSQTVVIPRSALEPLLRKR